MSENMAAFGDEEIKRAERLYVEPDCAQTDPANESDLLHVAAVRQSIFGAVDNFFGELESHRYLIILADSGMGKTTFCLNYFVRKQRSKRAEDRKVAVVPLGRSDALTLVGKISDPRDTILLLDALDEDTEAVGSFNDRLTVIMTAVRDFRRVVITCRSQFFADEMSIPKETGIAYFGARPGGERGEYQFYKLYLLPFSVAQVNRYVALHFPFFFILKKRRALSLIESIGDLGARPMLIEQIPELVKQKKSYSEVFELYAFMVDRWLQRESRWIDPNKLLAVSKVIAVDIYLGRTRRRTEKLTSTELADLGSRHGTDIDQWHLTSRSLLNRDSGGNYKFAHRSIMEFLFVLAFVTGEGLCAQDAWTDHMRELFYSWGRSDHPTNNAGTIAKVLGSDLNKTNLLPFTHPMRAPAILTKSQLSRVGTERRPPAHTLPPRWHAALIHVSIQGAEMSIEDVAYKVTYTLPATAELEVSDRIIYRNNIHELGDLVSSHLDQLDLQPRLPSAEEILALWETEKDLPHPIFDRGEYYWLGDILDSRRRLVFNINKIATGDNRVVLVSQLKRRVAGSETLNIYEVSKPPRILSMDRSFNALVIRRINRVGTSQ
ncbi:NACHT domain-containing protein [Caballeronia sp. 15711]|uniref:NACHT domain-containing protein n=1 Tax=Caballeronia sp. 15711 TaxID=3391029 RepID=UPI0039E3B4E4